MLIFPKSVAGITLIELMIAITILSILLIAGLPESFKWMQNTRIRTAAESVSNGLQLARGEAVRRNTKVEFVLTSDPPVNAGVSTNTTGPNWVVRDLTGTFIQGAAETSPNVVITSGSPNVVFNGLGRVTLGANTIQVTNPTGGACIAAGPMRCLNIVVQIGGQIRMCDPSITAAGDTRKC